MRLIDLRSDTVTKPSAAMRSFMMNANVGDDVYGEDPTVIELQKRVAEMGNKEDALFTPTATQSNLLALISHCERGDEAIVGATSHTYWWEGGGAAVLGSVQYQTVPFEEDATIDFAKAEKLIKPIDPHHVRTRLFCLENTHHGKALPLDYLGRVRGFCTSHKLLSHMDGARVFNAVVATNAPLHQIVEGLDSFTICFSKGLGAPVGSVLVGSREMISKARRWRKAVGGGMRQAGILAAGCLFALDHNIDRLAEDHENAKVLAAGLQSIDEIEIDLKSLNTNMFWFTPKKSYTALVKHLAGKGIIFPGAPNVDGQVRLVTHLDVSRKDIEKVIDEVKLYFK